MNAVAKIPKGSPLNRAPASPTDSMIAVIERAVTNPNIDVEKMERLLAMQERVMERSAKAAYIEALRNVKRNLPVIEQNGRITIMARGAKPGDEPIQSTPYTKYEDIDAAITPILDEHGMVLSFRTNVAADGRLVVTGVLSHKDGHQDTTTLSLPHDSSGSKNGVQAVGSSLSYGKRYCATALLNLVSKGDDDDGEAGGKLPSAHAAKQTDMGARCADLANEIKELEGLGACAAWANARAAEIATFPKRWQDMLREDLIAHKAFLREQMGEDDGFPGDRPLEVA